ncbi:MAG: OmpA/MotB domain protein [Ilumatobacteraceae bacterium]|nr:OmpA/MotB domain protein [Ilumatobacteraceae bacterium]
MSGKSRGNHRHEEHEEHEEHVNHEAWVIPYADMLTLLMALFLVLFAVGRTDIEKFKKLAESFRHEFGNGGSAEIVSVGTGSTGDTPIDGGNGVLDSPGMQPTPEQIDTAIKDAEKAAAETAVAQLDTVRQEIQSVADAQGVGDKITFTFEGRGLILTILDDTVLFEPGQATLQPAGLSILDLVTASLVKVPNDIAIEGHTDSRPISTSRYPSNWELSTARATSVLRYMLLQGFDPARISAAGYADTRPVADNATPEGQAANRRVEIVIVSDIPLDKAVEIDG